MTKANLPILEAKLNSLFAKPKKLTTAQRISRATVGYRIPMLTIPALYKRLQALVDAGATDEALRAAVAAADGVEEA